MQYLTVNGFRISKCFIFDFHTWVFGCLLWLFLLLGCLRFANNHILQSIKKIWVRFYLLLKGLFLACNLGELSLNRLIACQLRPSQRLCFSYWLINMLLLLLVMSWRFRILRLTTDNSDLSVISGRLWELITFPSVSTHFGRLLLN